LRHQLLGLLQPDQAGQQPGAAAVGHQAPAHEHLHEPGAVGRHDQVAGHRQVRAQPGGRPVDRGDHRLLAVENRAHQPLGAPLQQAGDVADDALGGVGRSLAAGGCRQPGPVGRRPGGPQVGAGAEVTAGRPQHHHPHLDLRRRGGQQVDDPVPLVGGQGVAGLGPVERDRQDPVLPAHQQGLVGAVGVGHGGDGTPGSDRASDLCREVGSRT
jgi:hypothetical protein